MIDFDTKTYYYDQQSGDRVIHFIEKFITHVKGEKALTPLIS